MTRTAGRNGFLASALNVTTLVSIFAVVIFAAVTQLLAASGAISLSTTLQLTMWLVALGFVVLLAIAYMFFRVFEPVYKAATSPQQDHVRYGETMPADAAALGANGQQAKIFERYDAQEGAQPGQDPGSPVNPTDGPHHRIPGWSPDGGALRAGDAWVPPDEFRQLDGSEYAVSTEEVFPDGCYLVPDSITPVSDQPTGPQVYKCRVVDRNPALKDRPHETAVKILADQMPTPPTGVAFELVEFEHLTITPYVTDRNPMRIRYSLRATGIKAAATPTRREQGKWTVPAPRDVPDEEAVAHASTGDAPGGAAGTS